MKNLELWSTTPASNNKNPPLGAPEEQAARSINDVQREMMGSVKTWYNQFWSVSSKSANYSVTDDDWNSVFICTNTITITLPDIADVAANFTITVFNNDANTKTITGAETINGDSSVTITNQYDAMMLINNGTEWERIDFPWKKTIITNNDHGDWSGNLNGSIKLFPLESPSLLSDPGTLPPGITWYCRFSPDGEFFAIPNSSTPYITIYQIIGNTFNKVADPGTLPPDESRDCAWSPDSSLLAVAHWTTPFITIYQRTGTTFTKLANPASLPTGNGIGCDFSPTGELLCVADASGTLAIYQSDGAATPTFTKQTNPSGISGGGHDVKWSPSGKYFALTTNDNLYVIERTGLVSFTLLQTSTVVKESTSLGWDVRLAWSPDSQHIAVSVYNTIPDNPDIEHVTIYSWNGTDFTDTTSLGVSEEAGGVFWSPDSYLAVTLVSSPYIKVFDPAFNLVTMPATAALSRGIGLAWSKDQQFLAMGHDLTPFISIYQTSGAMSGIGYLRRK